MIAEKISNTVTSIVIDDNSDFCQIDFVYNNDSSNWTTAKNSNFKNNKEISLDVLIRKTISKYYTENDIGNYDKRFLDNYDDVKSILTKKFPSLQ